MNLRLVAAILLFTVAASPLSAADKSGSARALYARTLEREQQLRGLDEQPTIVQLRSVVNAYAAIVRRFPSSGYADNALWQGANVALLAFERFGQDADRRTADRMLTQLKEGYPSSSLVARAGEILEQTASPVLPSRDPAAPPIHDAADRPGDGPSQKAVASTGTDAVDIPPAVATSAAVMIRDIKRTAIPEGMRVTIEMDAEASFRAERLENPRRVFFDLKGTRPVPALLDATLRFNDQIVREIRLGRHPQATTRVVFDMEGVDSYSVFTLYGPYRLVIDFKPQGVAEARGSNLLPPVADTRSEARTRTHTDKRASSVTGDTSKTVTPPGPTAPVVPSLGTAPLPAPAAALIPSLPLPEVPARPAAAKPVVSVAPVAPTLPSANLDGKFSLSRQLGLGVARIVIDAGHGGHDPGAQGNGVSESELTLDVATRLGRLLEKQPGVEVVLTRDTDVFVPLEERTAIANREGADLFLSIHANASRNPHAKGIETYFLNFASNPDAEAVAARENSASGRAMHSLPDIVRAIALNNKIDESRDFADIVQRSMVRRLSSRNKQLRDLGVKQAPFVVLIGAAMPSVLAEISFVTHRQEGQLLKSSTYRQQIAEALLDAVLRYQQSLKRPRTGIVGMDAR